MRVRQLYRLTFALCLGIFAVLLYQISDYLLTSNARSDFHVTVIGQVIQQSSINSRSKRHILSSTSNTTDLEFRHLVNVHYWDYICGYTVESLRSHPLFPYLPFRRRRADKVELYKSGVRFGARIFGYLHPKWAGNYQFALSSDDGSEFWLSSSSDPLLVTRLAAVGGKSGKEWSYRNQFDKYASQLSTEVFLISGGKYFFEILWKQEIGRGHVQLLWKQPGERKFQAIESRYLSKYYNDDFLDDGLVYEDHLKKDITLEDLPSHVNQFTKNNKQHQRNRRTQYERDSKEFLSLPVLDFQKIRDILPLCEYEPTYLVKQDQADKVRQYEGIHMTHYYNLSIRLWPSDKTWQYIEECIGDHLKPMHCQGNKKLDESIAIWISNRFMSALDKKFPRQYILHTLVNVEQGNDDRHGHRYLLEAALHDKKTKQMYRLSVYLYNLRGKKKICYPRDFQWNPSARVYLILTVKNQGPWVYQYILSLKRIYHTVKNSNFALIVVDFNSYDIHLERVLELSGLPDYKILRKNGNFYKTVAIQEAAGWVSDQNAIILQTDLHLEFPLNFIDDVRKHCVQGKMGYTPIVLRLGCGRFPYKPGGYWEYLGYGIFGLYKSDWDYVGGMNTMKAKHSWGGEDWEFGDNVIKNGYEIERIRAPNFYHYYHSKSGMWDGKAA